MRKLTVTLCAACLIFLSCGANRLAAKRLTLVRADGTQVMLTAEMARTMQERQRGFMERKKIPDGTGMLFLFESDQILSFYMKNTPTPLSIAYITSDGRIKDIFDMTPYSLANVSSTVSVRYALEVPQGWFSKSNIRSGDTILLDFN